MTAVDELESAAATYCQLKWLRGSDNMRSRIEYQYSQHKIL